MSFAFESGQERIRSLRLCRVQTCCKRYIRCPHSRPVAAFKACLHLDFQNSRLSERQVWGFGRPFSLLDSPRRSCICTSWRGPSKPLLTVPHDHARKATQPLGASEAEPVETESGSMANYKLARDEPHRKGALRPGRGDSPEYQEI